MAINLSKQTKNTRGFTLVELSVVLVIIGILISALMPLYKTYTEQSRKKTQETRMGTVRTALADFIIDDPLDSADSSEKRFPCPASRTAAIGSADYGVEQCITGGPGTCVNGVCIVAGTGGKNVLIGAIPTRTLRIGAANMNDSYNNRYTYAVSMDLVQPNAMDNMTSAGAIRMVDDSGAEITSQAQFALVSHGVDGAGSYTAAGIKNGTNCRTTSRGDAENCNDDATFRDNINLVLKERDGLSAATGAATSFAQNEDYYDDTTAFTLVKDDDDEWWRETNPSGLNIVNRNTQNVGIGFPTGEPQQRLDVNGSIRSRIDAIIDQTVRAGVDVIAAANVTAGNNSTAGNNVAAGNNVTSGMDVIAGRNVRAQSDVTADRDVRGTRDVSAGNNVTAGNEVTATNNIRAGKSIYAKENFYGKHFFYSDVPSGGTGGGGGNATVTAICPEGKVLRGIDTGSPICVTAGGTGPANFSCEVGSYVNRFDSEGKPQCTSIKDSGAVATFNCPAKPHEDGQGYKNISANWCTSTKNTPSGNKSINPTWGGLAYACIDTKIPEGQDMWHTAPVHPWSTMSDFLNTCGKRYCTGLGYSDGRVVEYGASGSNPDGTPYAIPKPSTPSYTAGHIPPDVIKWLDDDFLKRPLEVKCTVI